jgi:predicted PurR-regulated permease PerM
MYFNIVLLFFAGILLAVLLRFLSSLIEKFVPVGEKTSLLITLSILLTVSGAILFFSLPEISRQISLFLDSLPDALNDLRNALGRIGLDRFAEDIPAAVKKFSSRPDVLTRITGLFSTTFGFIADMGIILFIAVFLAANPDFYVKGTIRIFPPSMRKKASFVLGEVENTLRWWLLGRAIAMVFIGILTTLGLWAIGIPLALLLGVLAGLLSFIPYLGPILSILPAILFAIPQGLQTLGFVLVLYAAIQIIETHILTPIIQLKAVDIAPAYGIIFQVMLGVAAGGFGVVMGGPLAAVSVVLFRELYLKPIETEQE